MVGRTHATPRRGLAAFSAAIDTIVTIGSAADAGGFDSVWTSELYSRSASITLAALAQRTARCTLGSGIMYAVGRTPVVLAAEARDLHELSGGRFVLGLGNGTRRMVADWHGLDPEAPATRMEELVPLLRRLWRLSETPVDHEGRFYRVRIAALDDLAAEPVEIPIYTAGVNPRMIESAGRVADGLLGHSLFGPRYITDVVRPALERGARKTGRDPGDVRLTTFALTAVHADEEIARREAAGMIAFYASVRTYAPLLATAGFEREALAVQEAFRRGDADGMVAAVSERMVDELAVAGTPEQVDAGLRRFDGLVDEVVLFPPAFRMPEERIEQTARALIAGCAPAVTAASARRPPAAPAR